MTFKLETGQFGLEKNRIPNEYLLLKFDAFKT